MPRYAERVAAPGARSGASAATRRQPRPAPAPRPPLWHVLQLRAAQSARPDAAAAPSRDGLPTGLKAGVEQLSGIAMDDVRVHRNSPEPAKLGAAAYAQGSDIHVGPGQDRHLAHEAWHVVQQKQGRVKPRLQMKGVAINNDNALEREADLLGAKALRAGAVGRAASATPLPATAAPGGATQLKRLAAPDGVTADTENVTVYFNSGALVIDTVWLAGALDAANRPALLTAIANAAGVMGANIDRLASQGWNPNANSAGRDDVAKADPVRVRFPGTYGPNHAKRRLDLDYHYGSKFAGYVLHVFDNGPIAIDKEMHDRDSNVQITNAEYSSTHNIPNQAPTWDLERTRGEHAADAVTKIAGEGARWQVIAANAGKVRNNTKIFTNKRDDGTLSGDVRYVLFQDLWKSWDLTFKQAWGISNDKVAAKLQGNTIAITRRAGPGTANVTAALSSQMDHAVDVSVDDPPPQSAQGLAVSTMGFLHYKKNDPSIVKSQGTLGEELDAARLAVAARAAHKGVEGYLGGDVFTFLCSWNQNAQLSGVAGYAYEQGKTVSYSYPAYREDAAIALAGHQATTPPKLREGATTLAGERGALYTEKFRALVSAVDAYARTTGIKNLDTKKLAGTAYPHKGAEPVPAALQTTVWNNEKVKPLVDSYVAARDKRRLEERQKRLANTRGVATMKPYVKDQAKKSIKEAVEKDPEFA